MPPELIPLIKPITESGMGVLSFAALLYFGFKFLSKFDQALTNDLPHIKQVAEEIRSNTQETNRKLDEIIQKLKN